MFPASPERKPNGAGRERRRELERRLDAFGFVHGLRVYRGGPNSGAMPGAQELRATLQDLGPVFEAFGLYLSSRPDLFSPEECMELARIPDAAPPLAFRHIREIVAAECGVPIEEIFQGFDPEPMACRLAWQSHRAVLYDGSPATVRVLSPRFLDCAIADEAFLASCDESRPLGAAAHDFRSVLLRSLDLRILAEALRDESRDAARFEDAAALSVAKECATQRVLALRTVAGELPSCAEEHRPQMARQVCLLWMRQALEGRAFAVEPRVENIAFFGGRRLAFHAGEFCALPAASQEALWEYLSAAGNDDPDAAAAFLLREMDATAECVGEEAFIRQIRQIVPFRDGAWKDTGGQTLPERLFLQWQIAVKCGYRPQPRLIAFWRGLFTVAAAARELAPDSPDDAFLAAFTEYRSIRLVEQIQALMDLKQMGDRFDTYTVAALDFPRRLNQFLDAAESGRTQVRIRNDSRRRRRGSNGAVLMALLSAAALWTGLLGAHSANRIAIERVGAAGFFILGILLIRFIVKAE